MAMKYKLTFETPSLQKATKELSPLAGASFNPNLKNFLIEINPNLNSVKFTARDDNTQASVRVKSGVNVEDFRKEIPVASSEEESSHIFALDAKKFSALVGQFVSERTFLEISPTECLVKSGTGKYSFDIMSGNDFPRIQVPRGQEESSLVANPAKLIDGLKFCSFSLTKANKNIESNLETIKFDLGEKSFKISATDRYRFSFFNDLEPPEQQKEQTFCLSSGGADYLVKTFLAEEDAGDEFLFDIIGENVFYAGFFLSEYEKEVYISLLDALTYPDILKNVQEKFQDEKGNFVYLADINLDKKELNKALSRMKLMVDERNHQIVLTAEKDKFEMKVQSRQYSGTKSATEEVHFEDMVIKEDGEKEGSSASVALNCGFLLDSVKFFDSEQIHLLVLGENKPIILYGENIAEKYLLIMNQQL